MLFLILAIHLARQPLPVAPVANQPESRKPAIELVATITNAHRCVWEKDDSDLSDGTALAAGRRLQLKEGLAELTFLDGAKVFLEGPATFDVQTARQGSLQHGNLVANVPKGAEGFSIRTPLATVIDLGTEFGVSVGKDGVVETHVFVGRVGVETKASQKEPARVVESLTAGQTVTIQMAGTTGILQVKKIASAPKQFVRRVPPSTNKGLPEPKIIFAHRGDRDPKTEGWEFINTTSDEPSAEEQLKAGPIRDKKTPAWSIVDDSQQYGLRYLIGVDNGLTQALRDEARAKGWVLRARLKVISRGPANAKFGIGYCSYWDKNRRWKLRPMVNSNGLQCLVLPGKSTLGKDAMIEVPNSRDQYIDYEMRYYPKTNDADLYINGRFAATLRGTPTTNLHLIQFGTLEKGLAELRCAQAEWGIIEEK